MTIRQEMTSAVSGAHIDLTHLSAVARTQGTRAVRRRRATAVGAAAALAVAVGVGATAVVPGGSGRDPADPGPGPGPAGSPEAPDLTTTVPATGPGAVAALRYTVEDTLDGSSTGFTSQGPYGAQSDLTGRLVFTSAISGVASLVQVSISTSEDVPAGSLCGTMSRRCTQTGLPDGSVLLTFQDALASDPGPLTRSAVLWRSDGTQVSVFNSTGQDIPGHETWGRLSDEPSLTFGQLADIARQPWWGETLPATFVEEGESLDVGAVDDFD